MDHQRKNLLSSLISSQKLSRRPFFVLAVVAVVSVMGAAVVIVGWWKGFNVYTLVFISSILVASVVMSSKHTRDGEEGDICDNAQFSQETQEPSRGIPSCSAAVRTSSPELSFQGTVEEGYTKGPNSSFQNGAAKNSGSSDFSGIGSLRRWPAPLKANEEVGCRNAGSLPFRMECDDLRETRYSADANRTSARQGLEWNEDWCTTLNTGRVTDNFLLLLPTVYTTNRVRELLGGIFATPAGYTPELQHSNKDPPESALLLGNVVRGMSNQSPFCEVDSTSTKPLNLQTDLQMMVPSVFQAQQVNHFVSSCERMLSTRLSRGSAKDIEYSNDAEDLSESRSSTSTDNLTDIVPSLQPADQVEAISAGLSTTNGALKECL